jgi:hypothetical protein
MNPAQQFLALPPQRRALAFEQAATQRAVDAVLIEKDFWVCWLLGMLFSQPALGPVADEFPAVFADWHCEVVALGLARSFWEKATILHAEYHRPADQPTPSRYARHYADLARLLEHSEAEALMADKALCAHVVAWKSRVFARGWARYDLARHGEFRLVPPARRQEALAADYALMRPMFLRDSPPFAQVMTKLAAAEQTINSL